MTTKKQKASVTPINDDTNAKTRYNGWVNILTGEGTSSDYRQAGFFSNAIVPIHEDELESMFHNSDFARTIVERIVLDALRNEPKFKIIPSSDQDAGAFSSENEIASVYTQSWNVVELMTKAATWGRLYGFGAILLGVDDGKDLAEPLELPIKPGSLKFLEVLDKKNVTPIDYYKPGEKAGKTGKTKLYQIQFDTATRMVNTPRIHESRLIILGGQNTSSRVRVQNRDADISVLQDKYDILRDTDNVWFSANQLIKDASQSVFKIKDLAKIISGNKQDLLDRVRIVDYSKATGRSILIDGEYEDYYHVGAENLGGAEPLVQQAFQRLAAAANMPVTVLLGQSPGGLNATGESDARNWFTQVEAYQRKTLQEPLNKLMTIVAQTEGLWTEGDTVVCEFPSLWETTEEEKVDISYKKPQTAEILLRNGILSVEELKAWFMKENS